ncbi:transporter [Luteimonas sp. BDR2-5]|uniref:SphA family protein n=1 Tax=Proluteimonas luteida TaxID=2878685 RepID=UPI001E4CF797|nr:transporter [Luteimonas sp. BDR2-5]MCD9029150.1 transporter [Luteimonas sp. BDR2-5]
MLSCLLPVFAAHAGEGVKPAGPIGGTDIGQALLPPPGLYGVTFAGAVNIDGFFDDSGSRMPVGGDSYVGGVGLMYVYPRQVFGGSIATTLAIGYERTCVAFKPAPESCSSGLFDAYSDVVFWTRFFPNADFRAQGESDAMVTYGLAFGLGVGVTFPTGEYSAGSPINVGSNVYGIAPSIALTYNRKSIFGEALGQATEFSGRLFLNNYTDNEDTDWSSGRMLSFDFAVTQRQDQWQYGVAGVATYQIQDDIVQSVNIGNRAKGVALGPIVSRNFIVDGRPYILSAKALLSVAGENGASSQALVVRFGTRF